MAAEKEEEGSIKKFFNNFKTPFVNGALKVVEFCKSYLPSVPSFLYRIFNAKVCWTILLFYPILIWTAAGICIGVILGPGLVLLAWAAASPGPLVSLVILWNVIKRHGGIWEYLCVLDGRDYPCFGVRTERVGGIVYDSVAHILPLRSSNIPAIAPPREEEEEEEEPRPSVLKV